MSAGKEMVELAGVDALRKAAAALAIAAEQDTVADWPEGVDGGLLDNVWSAIDGTYPVIWTDKQVAAIDAWQNCGWVHPLTCPNHGDSWHKDEDGEEVLPVALPQGLACRSCGYRQFSVPDVCLLGAPRNPAEIFRTRTPDNGAGS